MGHGGCGMRGEACMGLQQRAQALAPAVGGGSEGWPWPMLSMLCMGTVFRGGCAQEGGKATGRTARAPPPLPILLPLPPSPPSSLPLRLALPLSLSLALGEGVAACTLGWPCKYKTQRRTHWSTQHLWSNSIRQYIGRRDASKAQHNHTGVHNDLLICSKLTVSESIGQAGTTNKGKIPHVLGTIPDCCRLPLAC